MCTGQTSSLSFGVGACNCVAGIDTDGDGLNDFAQITISLQPAFAGEGPYTATVTGLFDNAGVAYTSATLGAVINSTDPLSGNTFSFNVFLPADNTTTFDLSITDADNPTSAFNVTNEGPCSACSTNPIPTASEWGLLCLAVLLLTTITLYVRRPVTVSPEVTA